jgi:pyrimidine-nucleoside phosphorylase/thymidine phosphorylase
VALGAGRSRLDDVIDPGVGIELLARPGDEVGAGDPVLRVSHRAGRGLEEALGLLKQAIEVGDAFSAAPPIVVDSVDRNSPAVIDARQARER